MGTCSGDVLISATCPVSAPKSVRGFVGRLKVSSSGRGPVGRAKAHSLYTVELVNIIADAQAGDQNLFVYFKVGLRTRIPVSERLLHRGRCYPHFSTPFRTPLEPRATSSVILPSFACSRRQQMLVYCCINSRRCPLGVVGCRSTYIGRYRVVSRWGRFAGFFGA